jgi:ABC-type transporter Mla subunit MlaD
VPYATADARQQLLDTLAEATEDLARALASLTEAYEMLDENSAERLEQALFVPVQVAYGRARRTYTEFAGRVGLPGRAFAPPVAGAPGKGIKGFLDDAVQAVSDANGTLATLQDSLLPVEVGDAQLRAGLEQVRTQLDGVGARARELGRTIGR